MPKFIKGSQEAKDHMAKIREAKKSGNKKTPNPNKGIRKKNATTKVELPMVNQSSIAVPEFFANKNVDKKGKITYRLVNPLTKTRNLSKRNGETSIKIIRKPIENMVIMEHQTEPIPLSLFSKKDREIIDTHFKVVSEHKGKEILEVPHSKPFQNKERGRPEKLPKNIEVNKQRKGQKKQNIKMEIKKKEPENIVMNIEENEEENEEPKPKRKNKKYASEEERKEAIKQQKRESAKRIRDAKKGKGIEGGKLAVKHIKGLLNASYDKSVDNLDGFIQDKSLSSNTTKVYHNPTTGQVVVAHKGTQGLTDWFNNGVYAYGGERAYKMTPRYREAKKIQEEAEKKYGANNISTIGHSQGGLQAELLGGKTKETITLNKATRPNANHKNANQTDIRTSGDLVSFNNPFQKNNGKEITIKSNTHNPLKEHMIDVLDNLDQEKEIGEGIYDSGTDSESEKGEDYVVQSVVFDKNKYSVKEAKKWLKTNGYKSPKIDEEINTIRFRQKDPKKVHKEGFTEYRNKKLGKSGIILVIAYRGKNNISNNNIMPKFAKGSKEAKEHMARIRSMKGKSIGGAMVRMPDGSFKGVGSDAVDSHMIRPLGSDPRTWTPSHIDTNKASMGSGLYAGGSPSGGSIGSIIDEGISGARHLLGVGIPPHSRSYGSPMPMMGFGVHHHHHYHIQGEGMWDWADPNKNGVAKAFDPNKNGVAKAFDPNQNGVAKAFEPVKDVAVNTFTPQLGRDITSGLIHQALPAVVSGLAGSATTALTGNPYAGFAVGQTLGKYAGKQAGDAVGNATGYGFKKGSKEAKEHMAKIRAMKGKGIGGKIVGKVY